VGSLLGFNRFRLWDLPISDTIVSRPSAEHVDSDVHSTFQVDHERLVYPPALCRTLVPKHDPGLVAKGPDPRPGPSKAETRAETRILTLGQLGWADVVPSLPRFSRVRVRTRNPFPWPHAAQPPYAPAADAADAAGGAAATCGAADTDGADVAGDAAAAGGAAAFCLCWWRSSRMRRSRSRRRSSHLPLLAAQRGLMRRSRLLLPLLVVQPSQAAQPPHASVPGGVAVFCRC